MQVLREFNGTCRGQLYTYKVMRVDNELILESYNDSGMVDRLTWHDSPSNEALVNKACLEIQQRG